MKYFRFFRGTRTDSASGSLSRFNDIQRWLCNLQPLNESISNPCVSSSRSFFTAKISLLGKPNYRCSVATSIQTRSHITFQAAPAGVSSPVFTSLLFIAYQSVLSDLWSSRERAFCLSVFFHRSSNVEYRYRLSIIEYQASNVTAFRVDRDIFENAPPVYG